MTSGLDWEHMWLGGHLQVGWFLGATSKCELRDRVLVAWAGVLPDLDALTRIAGTDAYLAGHHVYCHNLLALVVFPLTLVAFARRKLLVGMLAMAAIALHMLSDGFGALELRPLWPFASTIWWPADARWWVIACSEILVPTLLIVAQVWYWRRHRLSVLEALPASLRAYLQRRFAHREPDSNGER